MYYFCFDRFVGWDMVIYSTLGSSKAGELWRNGENFFLCLWDFIAFPELYLHKEPLVLWELVEKSFLAAKSIDLIHWMVYEWYSSYKSVIPLFLGNDLLSLLKYKKKWLENQTPPLSYEKAELRIRESKENLGQAQQLFVFPDLWTMVQILEKSWFDEKNYCVLHSATSYAYKQKTFWWIKSGKVSTLFSTHSQIFQDWKNLKRIEMIDPAKRYYKSQQDPRYSTADVVTKMADLYGVKLFFW